MDFPDFCWQIQIKTPTRSQSHWSISDSNKGKFWLGKAKDSWMEFLRYANWGIIKLLLRLQAEPRILVALSSRAKCTHDRPASKSQSDFEFKLSFWCQLRKSYSQETRCAFEGTKIRTASLDYIWMPRSRGEIRKYGRMNLNLNLGWTLRISLATLVRVYWKANLVQNWSACIRCCEQQQNQSVFES